MRNGWGFPSWRSWASTRAFECRPCPGQLREKNKAREEATGLRSVPATPVRQPSASDLDFLPLAPLAGIAGFVVSTEQQDHLLAVGMAKDSEEDFCGFL